MSVEAVVDKLNQLQAELHGNKLTAMSICEENGFPTMGSNYELIVEQMNSPVEEEMDDLIAEYCDYPFHWDSTLMEWVLDDAKVS